MGASQGSKCTALVLRILTLILLLISLFILVTNSKTIHGDYGSVKFRFSDFYAYRYMLAAIVIGLVLSLLQVVFSIYSVVSKGDGTILFDFFGDKFMSYLIITGSVAGLAVTVDLKANVDDDDGLLNTYFAKAMASSGLLLFAFFCTAIVSILSSFALRKRA